MGARFSTKPGRTPSPLTACHAGPILIGPTKDGSEQPTAARSRFSAGRGHQGNAPFGVTFDPYISIQLAELKELLPAQVDGRPQPQLQHGCIPRRRGRVSELLINYRHSSRLLNTILRINVCIGTTDRSVWCHDLDGDGAPTWSAAPRTARPTFTRAGRTARLRAGRAGARCRCRRGSACAVNRCRSGLGAAGRAAGRRRGARTGGDHGSVRTLSP